MATLTTQAVTRAGVAPTYAAGTSGGDACEVGDDIYLQAKNTSGGAITVTLAIPSSASTYSNVAYTSTTVSIPATTGDRLIGPISALYKDPTTGLCTITYSANPPTGLTIGCFKLQAP
jgi:hypothetical protein